jgi:hypothetical protein
VSNYITVTKPISLFYQKKKIVIKFLPTLTKVQQQKFDYTYYSRSPKMSPLS